MKYKNLMTLIIVSLLIINFSYAQNIEVEKNKLIGKYTGEWQAFKKDIHNNIVESVSWKDIVTTSELIETDTLIYVNVQSKLTFDNPQIPEFEMQFKEGFYLENNKISKMFFTYMNNEIEQIKTSENTYVYTQKINNYEFAQLGFNNAIEGFHTVIKVIINSEGQEIHKIKRITTVLWYDENKKIRNLQFVSLSGFHQKI